MGSKARIAKKLLQIMLEDIEDRPFMDLFCGGKPNTARNLQEQDSK